MFKENQFKAKMSENVTFIQQKRKKRLHEPSNEGSKSELWLWRKVGQWAGTLVMIEGR